jgi:hypothetical protein
MVKFGKIEKQEPPIAPPGNPYDLITVSIGATPTQARPYEFDSEAVDQNARNAQGQAIKPIKAMATCPNCGAGIDIDLRLGTQVGCDSCGLGQTPQAIPLPDPFCNPLTDGRLNEAELVEATVPDDLGKAVTTQDLEGTFNLPAAPEVEPPAPQKTAPQKPGKKVPPKPPSKPKKPDKGGAELGSAVDMGPEPE